MLFFPRKNPVPVKFSDKFSREALSLALVFSTGKWLFAPPFHPPRKPAEAGNTSNSLKYGPGKTRNSRYSICTNTFELFAEQFLGELRN
jgi:hypothetical protein